MVYLGLELSGMNRCGAHYPKALYGPAPNFAASLHNLLLCSVLVCGYTLTYITLFPYPLRNTISLLRHYIWNNGETVSI